MEGRAAQSGRKIARGVDVIYTGQSAVTILTGCNYAGHRPKDPRCPINNILYDSSGNTGSSGNAGIAPVAVLILVAVVMLVAVILLVAVVMLIAVVMPVSWKYGESGTPKIRDPLVKIEIPWGPHFPGEMGMGIPVR